MLFSQTLPFLCCNIIWTSPMYTQRAYHPTLYQSFFTGGPAVVAPEGQAKDGKQALPTVSGEAKGRDRD